MGLSRNDRSIAGFTMGVHAMVHWFETAIPIFLVAWTTTFDVSLAVLGIIVAIGYAPFGLGAVPAGILTDRIGARPLVIACLLGMSGGFLFVAIAPSVWLVGVGLFAWGVAASVYHPAGLSLISTGSEARGTVFAWHGIAGNLGIALGPLAAAILLVVGLDWRIVAALLALPALGFAVVSTTLQFDPRAAADAPDSDAPLADESVLSTIRALFASAFAVVFVVVVVEGLFYRGSLTYLPTIFHDTVSLTALEHTGLPEFEPPDFLYVGLLIVGIGGQYAGGKLTTRVSPARGLAGIFGLLALCAVAYVPVLEAGLVPLVVLTAVFGFTLFAIQPFYQNAVAVYTPADTRGIAYGLTYFGVFGLGAASVAIGGYVLEVFSTTAFFLLLAAIGGIGGVIAAGLSRRPTP